MNSPSVEGRTLSPNREPVHRLGHCRICNVLAFYVVSLGAVFWISRYVISKKAASRETTFSRDARKRFEYDEYFFENGEKKSPFLKISGKYPVPCAPVKRCATSARLGSISFPEAAILLVGDGSRFFQRMTKGTPGDEVALG